MTVLYNNSLAIEQISLACFADYSVEIFRTCGKLQGGKYLRGPWAILSFCNKESYKTTSERQLHPYTYRLCYLLTHLLLLLIAL